MTIPNHLIEAVREHRVVPFAGTGVSLSVKPGYFPSWTKLLEQMALELDGEALPQDASEVRRRIAARSYPDAAEWGYKKLGPHRFNLFMKRLFEKPKPAGADCSVVRAIWNLRPPIVITTNYDNVLRWAGPNDVRVLMNDQEDELSLLHRAQPEQPWVWHLHGQIDRMATLILSGSDYRSLYGSEAERARRYELALLKLRAHLAERPVLYVGFSLTDPFVLQQISDVLNLTNKRGVPSYALMKRGVADGAALWDNYSIQLIEYEDHGGPLVETLGRVSSAAWSSTPVRDGTTPQSEIPVSSLREAAIVPRPDMEADYLQTLRDFGRLLILAPRRGGAGTTARRIAETYFSGRVTLLVPPVVPSCTQAEYFGELAGDGSVKTALDLRKTIIDSTRGLGQEHLIVLRHDGGPVEHLITLGNMLRALHEQYPQAGIPRFYVLVAGGAKCAWLRFNTPHFSLFSGAAVRYVPPLSIHEIRASILQSRLARTRESDPPLSAIELDSAAASVYRATGGHSGFVSEAIHSNGPLHFDAVTTRIAESPSVRGVLTMRLADDERSGLDGNQHSRRVLRDMLNGRPVRKIVEIQDQIEYPEVRLYYDGLVVTDKTSGSTEFRCEAVRLAVQQAIGV